MNNSYWQQRLLQTENELCFIKKALKFNNLNHGSLLESYQLAERLKKLSAKFNDQEKKTVIYGAGKHTEKLLAVYPKELGRIISIVDDNPTRKSISSIPILPFSELTPDFDLLIISSDTYEDAMFKKATEAFGTTKQIIRIYRDTQDHPIPEFHLSGRWLHSDLQRLADLVKDIPGDFSETGVYKGDSFSLIAKLAKSQNKHAHAFDSFEGMAEPGDMDNGEFPKGKFNIGGLEAFIEILSKKDIPSSTYSLNAGFIPECFVESENTRFSFAILDVDHYQPTVEALKWLWPRINTGGLLALDDYYPDLDSLASKAINEFMKNNNNFEIFDQFNNQLILKKN
ncbi:MAG: class I SAM-dependent methyltransferase [Lentisphaeraceae bacterium]|nr:class I SAM-dependent methyltransferase [Lentisphaeraceae bacterium]